MKAVRFWAVVAALFVLGILARECAGMGVC
jgi:hypothetical protein